MAWKKKYLCKGYNVTPLSHGGGPHKHTIHLYVKK